MTDATTNSTAICIHHRDRNPLVIPSLLQQKGLSNFTTSQTSAHELLIRLRHKSHLPSFTLPATNLQSLAKMSSNGWEIRFSNSRQIPYFYNSERSISTWEPPSELSAEQIQQLPGAAKYMNLQSAQTSGGKEGQVRASHILAKHAGSRRPASWRNVRVI